MKLGCSRSALILAASASLAASVSIEHGLEPRSFCSKKNPMYLGNPLELGASAATASKTSDLLSPGAKSDASMMHRSMCSDLFATRNAANTEHFPTCSCHFSTYQEVWKLSCQRDQPLKTQRWKLFTILDIIKCNQWILYSRNRELFRKRSGEAFVCKYQPWHGFGHGLGSILWDRIHSVVFCPCFDQLLVIQIEWWCSLLS